MEGNKFICWFTLQKFIIYNLKYKSMKQFRPKQPDWNKPFKVV